MGRTRVRAVVAICSLLTTGAPAWPEICAIDAVPAATLLVPYFGVDLNRRSAPDTILSVNNASAAPAPAQLTFWTVESVPALAFTVVLTGYDIETISLRDLFVNGTLPSSVDPDCVLPSSAILEKASARGGQASRRTRLSEKLLADGAGAVARGYVTIDSVNEVCARLFPNEEGYFTTSGTSVANDFNTLYGQVYAKSKKQVAAYPMVAIEASATDNRVGTAGRYTFYGRYFDFDARDHREPLNAVWAARYSSSGPEKSYLQVWRDSGPFDLPLPQSQIVVFNTEEEAVEVGFDPPEDLFPLESQEVEIGRGLPTPYGAGWIYLNLSRGNQPLQAFALVRQDLKKSSSLFQAIPWYDAQSVPDASSTLCGPAPSAQAQ